MAKTAKFGNETNNTVIGLNGDITLSGSAILIKSGGTSTQFLMADGTTSTSGSTIFDGRYLSLSGGTLSNGLTGTTIYTSGNITSNDVFNVSLNRTSSEVGVDTKLNTGIPSSERQKFKVTISSGTTITASLSFVGTNTSFSYYINDKKFTVTSSNILAYTATGTSSDGVWFFYIEQSTTNASSPGIILSKTPWTIVDPDVLLWNFYVNGTDNSITWIGEERHTAGRDIFQHARNHAEGAVYSNGFSFSQYNGLTSTTLASNTDNNFGRAMTQIAAGSFFDEDIKNTIYHSDLSINSTTDNPTTDWNLNVSQYLGFNDTNTSTTAGTLTFTLPHTLVTGQAIAVMIGSTTTNRGTFTVISGGTRNSFAVTTQTGSNTFANGDTVVVGARIPIYYINSVVDTSYTWRRLSTTDFLGVHTAGVPITPANIATATAQYNVTTGGFTPVSTNRHYPVYLMATNMISEPIIAVLGQGQSTSSILATTLTESPFQFTNLVGLSGLAIQEVVPFMRLTFAYNTGGAFSTTHIKLLNSTFLNIRSATISGSFFGTSLQQTASTTPFIPYGNISGLTVQIGMQELDDIKFNKVGGTITGAVSIEGTLNVLGNIIQSGSTYETHLNHIYTTGDTITLRDGAISGQTLGVNQYTGLIAKYYDGSNDGVLVFDNNGVARVGDMNTVTWTGSTQPIATREESPLHNGFAYWDTGTTKFNTKILVSDDISDLTTTLDSRYVNIDGDTMNGLLSVSDSFVGAYTEYTYRGVLHYSHTTCIPLLIHDGDGIIKLASDSLQMDMNSKQLYVYTCIPGQTSESISIGRNSDGSGLGITTNGCLTLAAYDINNNTYAFAGYHYTVNYAGDPYHAFNTYPIRGDGSGLYNIPSTGITGLSVQTDRITSDSNSAIISASGLTINTGVTATSFIKDSGTSSQFLMADGSTSTVDGSFPITYNTDIGAINQSLTPNMIFDIQKQLTGALTLTIDSANRKTDRTNDYMAQFTMGSLQTIVHPTNVRWAEGILPYISVSKTYFCTYTEKLIWTTNLYTGSAITGSAFTSQKYTVSYVVTTLGGTHVKALQVIPTLTFTQSTTNITVSGGTAFFTASMVGLYFYIGTTLCGQIQSITSTSVAVVSVSQTISSPAAGSIGGYVAGTVIGTRYEFTFTPALPTTDFNVTVLKGDTIQFEAREFASPYEAINDPTQKTIYIGNIETI